MNPDGGQLENVYEGGSYAEEYSRLQWEGTYHLIARDLPGIIKSHVQQGRALDFGCGTGRSTRLLRDAGFEAAGVDVAQSMVDLARQLSPDIEFRVIEDGDFSAFEPRSIAVILSCFPFDNIAGDDRKAALLRSLGSLLAPGGILVNVVSSPEIYLHEWVTFTTARFAENRIARDGDVVRTVTRGFEGEPVCDDILCGPDLYRRLYQQAGLKELGVHRPVGREDDGIAWVNEATIAPWTIWVLSAA